MVDGEGGSSEGCLKWGGGGGGLSKNILIRGWVKAKLFVGGGGLKVSPPLPPENFNYTPCDSIPESVFLVFQSQYLALIPLGGTSI